MVWGKSIKLRWDIVLQCIEDWRWYYTCTKNLQKYEELKAIKNNICGTGQLFGLDKLNEYTLTDWINTVVIWICPKQFFIYFWQYVL